ncbi:MAG: iron-containing alcohol dehydrogenase, partial [Candidatus Thorarchaeota archaeon]
MIPSFNFARIPNIIFGAGKLNELYDITLKFGKNILFVIGERSLKKLGKWDEISSILDNKSLNYSVISISNEPSPTIIDEAAAQFRKKSIELVVGIGGGSVTDAGKAISAMIPKEDSIKNYLEGVGNKTHDGKKIPFIAIPTTSGTGSEVTKNAVISEIGPNGFKKSLRHDNLIPNIALIDPELMISCPSSISAACGMDAFTQLLEAYVSPKGNPITDVLAFDGMRYMNKNILSACSNSA